MGYREPGLIVPGGARKTIISFETGFLMSKNR
jgi:hypothetical protein